MSNATIFRMYLTDKDHKVLQFVEEFGSITINECRNIFYDTQIKGYEIARRRLSKLVSYKKLGVYRDMDLNLNVYYMDKKLTQHGILALDYYSELIRLGASIIYFKQEQPWMIEPSTKKAKYFSDAYCCYHFEGKVYFDIVETVKTKNIETEKYLDIYNSKEAHVLSDEIYKQLGGKPRNLFPRLIIIDNVKHKNDLFINNDIKIIQLDFKLKNISKILV